MLHYEALRNKGVKSRKGDCLRKKPCWGLLCLSLIVLLMACGSEKITTSSLSSKSIMSDSLSNSRLQQSPLPSPTAIPPLSIPSHKATPVPTQVPHISASSTSTPPPVSNCVTYSQETTLVPAKTGTLAAPYGPAPVSEEAQQVPVHRELLASRSSQGPGLSPGCTLHSLRPVEGYWYWKRRCEVPALVQASLYGWESRVEG